MDFSCIVKTLSPPSRLSTTSVLLRATFEQTGHARHIPKNAAATANSANPRLIRYTLGSAPLDGVATEALEVLALVIVELDATRFEVVDVGTGG